MEIPDEEKSQGGLVSLVHKLNRKSVEKRYEAYRDIDWEAPQNQIDPRDPRFELPETHPLARTAWYRSLGPEDRSRVGLAVVAQSMKVGVLFENVLTRGLLSFALAQKNGSPLFRYAYHESIEESHHSLMFQEVVNRSGVEPMPLPRWQAFAAERVVKSATRFPELFFIFVLGGEDPIDYAQRTALANGRVRHPLLQRVSQIHITEEARHLAFARAYLREQVPKLSPVRKRALAILAPIILHVMARMMLDPPVELLARYGAPEKQLREVYKNDPEHRASIEASLGKVRALMKELLIA